jgi:hypothetical protein
MDPFTIASAAEFYAPASPTVIVDERVFSGPDRLHLPEAIQEKRATIARLQREALHTMRELCARRDIGLPTDEQFDTLSMIFGSESRVQHQLGELEGE